MSANEIKKDILSDISDFSSSKEEYDKMKIPWKRGYLLIGDPGLGKTMLIKGIRQFFNFETHKLEDMIDRKQNIRMVNSHYAEINNELSKECEKKGYKIRIHGTDDGKLWFWEAWMFPL